VKNDDATIFFQIPNFEIILKDLVFWDVYYEHSSYFTKHSLFRLFKNVGFSILNIWTDFDDQYLMIEAGLTGDDKTHLESSELIQLKDLVDKFEVSCKNKMHEWSERFKLYSADNKKAVVWSSSSKAVSFLTALKPSVVEYVIDINPRRQGFFMAGTGQEIKGPEFLKEYEPDVVIIMNPIYLQEIKGILKKLGVKTELLTV
jgi:hypothetical protein